MFNKGLIKAMKIILALTVVVVAANFLIADFSNDDIKAVNKSDTLKILEPKNHYKIENQLITTILSRYHYKKVSIDDSLSTLLFEKYLQALDFSRLYFLKSDIVEFEKYRNTLDDHLLDGDIEPFYEIFNLYAVRMDERLIYLDTMLAREFDYTTVDSVKLSRENAVWAEDNFQMNELWRKRLKSDALNLKLNGKDWDEIVTNLSNRYDNYKRLLDQYNSEDVFQLAMNSYASCLDPHTNYLSPITSENFQIDMSLSLEGIGARLMYDDGYTKVVEIIPGGPAFKSKKLQVDDRIVAVAQDEDGEFVDVVGWRITDVVQLIRGPKETLVRLQILPADASLSSTPIEIKLIRDKVKLEDQAAKSDIIEVENDGIPYRIGVITIPKFYTDLQGFSSGDKESKSTVTDVSRIVEELKNENVDGIVIDLRNNGGGSLIEAIDVTGLFIERGPVVQVKDSFDNIEVNNDPDPEIIYSGPLAVLINRFSASASEIFSAAIQDYERGIVLGEQSYGKGTVQNLVDLNRLASRNANKFGQIKVTIAKYYRITGGSTQNLGVIPDIEFPSYVDANNFGESSEPTALKWDQIKSTEFEKFEELSRVLPELTESSKLRQKNNPDFEYLMYEIEEYKLQQEKQFVSLNENLRLKEKEIEEEREFQRENIRRKKKGLKLLDKDEVPSEEEVDEDDPFLKESALIVTDLIYLNKGLTQIR
ncbi:MAG: carboxy terminal-processing peptidase [Ignavibacteriaceae bacterium]|nr:carboxy terminal-processing peptidase [Ignavibacteria bacterium]NNL22770.1 carboxy terminal-processing peptidase [Ignavibacteriaceae bacterium]